MSDHATQSTPPAASARDLRDTDASAAIATTGHQSTPGAALRAARQATQLSVGDVANRLRMGVKQVEALENDNYDALPKGTFLRGFVRNYAKIVRLDADQLLALLESSNEDARPYRGPSIVVPTQNIEVAVPGGQLAAPKARYGALALVLVLLGLAGWYWWAFIFNPAPPTAASAAPGSSTVTASAPTPASATPTPQITEPTAAPPVALSTPPATPVAATPSASATPAPVPPAEPAPAAVVAPQVDVPPPKRTDTRGVIGFTFAAPSWVEVIDGTGRTVLEAKFKAGDAEEITGRPPFSIVIGNAPATRMAYNGKEFDLAPHTKLTTARIKLK